MSAAPMHIAILIERFNPDAGGAERSTSQIAWELKQRGHDVTVLAGVCPEPLQEQWEDQGIEIKAWKMRGGFSSLRLLLLRQWMARQAEDETYDVTLSVTGNFSANVMQPRAGIAKRFQHQRIARRHALPAKLASLLGMVVSPKHWLLRAWEKASFESPLIHHVVAISPMMASDMQEVLGIESDQITLIANGAQPIEFTPEQRQETRTKLRETLGVDEDAPLFCFAANDPWRKGGRELVQAFARVVEQVPNAKLAMAGKHGHAMHELALQYEVRHAMLLLGPTGKIPELFAACDATVLPSWYDPSSKVVIESLMVGIPAITTRTNGACHFIEDDSADGPRGRVIDLPSDIAGLAQAMMDLCDPTEQGKCAERCQDMHEVLSMSRHVDELEAVLRDAAQAVMTAEEEADPIDDEDANVDSEEADTGEADTGEADDTDAKS